MGKKAGRGGGGAADGVESGTGGEAEMGRGGWKEEKEEQREETPLKVLTHLRDLSPPRCESHMC